MRPGGCGAPAVQHHLPASPRLGAEGAVLSPTNTHKPPKTAGAPLRNGLNPTASRRDIPELQQGTDTPTPEQEPRDLPSPASPALTPLRAWLCRACHAKRGGIVQNRAALNSARSIRAATQLGNCHPCPPGSFTSVVAAPGTAVTPLGTASLVNCPGAGRESSNKAPDAARARMDFSLCIPRAPPRL